MVTVYEVSISKEYTMFLKYCSHKVVSGLIFFASCAWSMRKMFPVLKKCAITAKYCFCIVFNGSKTEKLLKKHNG